MRQLTYAASYYRSQPKADQKTLKAQARIEAENERLMESPTYSTGFIGDQRAQMQQRAAARAAARAADEELGRREREAQDAAFRMMGPVMQAMAESADRLSLELQIGLNRMAEQNKPGPLAFSEWVWKNPFSRQHYYNRIGRILNKLEKKLDS